MNVDTLSTSTRLVTSTARSNSTRRRRDRKLRVPSAESRLELMSGRLKNPGSAAHETHLD